MVEGIKTAAVLGAGVMGSGIAAHLASAGIRTHLLDIVPPNLPAAKKRDPAARSAIASGALAKALKHKPAPFLHDDAARLITPGNFEDHAERLAECDLVIEAVVENLDIKKKLFGTIAAHIRPDAILASNTSGLSIAEMSAVLPAELQKRFLVTHFFNPVRYMKLLEVVAAPKTDPAVLERAARIGEALGKGIVYGKDTPNFVANRIGVHGLMLTMSIMAEDGYTIEEIDKIVGAPMGRPKTAVFQLCDLVGIDTMVHVARNCFENLPDDEDRALFEMPAYVLKLVENGALGRKSGAGFYKKVGADIHVLDLETGEYRAQEKVRFDSLGAVRSIENPGQRLKALVSYDDRAGQLAWKCLSRSLCYTARRLGEIADDVVNIDNAMRWGFNWDLGPFEAWDAIGVPESIERMKGEGLDVPRWVVRMVESGRTSFYEGTPLPETYYDVPRKKAASVPRDERALKLAAVRADKKNILKENMSAALLDLGDGVLCVEHFTKMNTLDGDVVEMVLAGLDAAEKDHQALVIGNDGAHFGAGANILMVVMAAQQKEWGQIESMVRGLQRAVHRMRYSPVPVVAAPFNLVLGGCAELAMGADACQAFAETYIGLVEVGVGLIPAGGGCTRMVERYTEEVSSVKGADLLPFIGQASLNIAMAKVATGAGEGKALRYLRTTDGVTWNRDHLLHDAKERALGMARSGYRPPLPKVLTTAGQDAAKTIGANVWGMVEAGYATEHDALIANKLAHILCGGTVAAGTSVDEQHYYDLEVEAFLSLCGEEKTQARIQHMLMNGKPLRN